MVKLKLWQLYLIPFLIIALILSGETLDFQLDRFRSFEEIAQDSQALAEVDQRTIAEAFVTKVVDGDTIEIETGEKVRFIGVDTPETVHPEKPVQCFGKEASRETKALLEGKTVWLEKDISETDRYGRLLRYIYLPNPEATDEAIFVNEYLIEQGYGQLITYPPDVKYHEILRTAQRKAQDEKKGLWETCQ